MDHKCTIRSEIFYLFRNGLTDVLLMSGALTVRNFLGMDLENKRADTSRLLLAVSWRYLRAGFLLNSCPWEPIKKAIKIKHLRNKNSNMDNLKDNTWENVNSPIFLTWSLCSLGCGFLLGDASRLPAGSLRALGLCHCLALFLLNGLALLGGHIATMGCILFRKQLILK